MLRIFIALLVLPGCLLPFASETTTEDRSAQEIISLERAALDRWGRGDPQGYLSSMEDEVTYFDPFRDMRIDGLQSMKDAFTPMSGKVHIDRYEMLNPRVQRYGDVAVLTFNLVDEIGDPKSTVRWNSTEVYRRVGGRWRIVHSHWSFVKPELRQAN